VTPEEGALGRVLESLLEAGFSVPVETAKKALRLRRQLNVIEMSNAAKIDLIIRKDRRFSREELHRSRLAELAGGLQARIATLEDTVLPKLEWARKAGGSEKQLNDVAGVLAVQGQTLDRAYIERCAGELGVVDLGRTLTAF
jgi:hypothetical protein